MSSDVDEVTERLEKEQSCGVGELTERLEHERKGWRMSCDVGETTEGLENELFLFCHPLLIREPGVGLAQQTRGNMKASCASP